MPETPTAFSKLKERLLNKKWVAILAIAGVTIIGLANFSESLRKLVEPFVGKTPTNEGADDRVIATEIVSNCYRRALHFGYWDRWANQKELERIMRSVAEVNGFLQSKLVSVTNRHPAILPHLQSLQESCSKIDESFQRVADWLESNKDKERKVDPETGAPYYYEHVVAAEKHRLQLVTELVALAQKYDIALPTLSGSSVLAQPRFQSRLLKVISSPTPREKVNAPNP